MESLGSLAPYSRFARCLRAVSFAIVLITASFLAGEEQLPASRFNHAFATGSHGDTASLPFEEPSNPASWLDRLNCDEDSDGTPCFRARIWRPTQPAKIRLRGRIDTDFIWVNQSAANEAILGEFSDTVGFRRARIGAEGNLTPESRYVAEIDLASGEVVIRDLYFGIGNVKETGEFKFGHMREPFSLEGGTSANSFAFMERSAINDLDPARNWGAEYIRCGSAEDFTVSVGIYQAGTDPSDLQFESGSETALTAKWTCLPWYEDHGRRLMHFGVVVSPRFADYGVVILKQKPTSPLLDLGDSSSSPFVPTIRVPANFQQTVNAQWALVNGSAWAQAEWYGTLIEQLGGPPVFYHGAYLDLGYFVTGEHRRYLPQAGVFGPVIVNRPLLCGLAANDERRDHGYGAWELTCRLSYLDYFDVGTPPNSQGQPVGTLLPQATVGVNWYLADRMRILFNYTYSVPDVAGAGASDANLFAMRLGVFW